MLGTPFLVSIFEVPGVLLFESHLISIFSPVLKCYAIIIIIITIIKFSFIRRRNILSTQMLKGFTNGS